MKRDLRRLPLLKRRTALALLGGVFFVIVGGVGVQTANGNSVTINVPTAGRIPSGASVERAVPSPFANGNHLVLDMHSADFTTANRIVDAINETFGKGTASAIDGGSIAVRAPATVGEKVGFIFPNQDTTGTHINISGVGVARYAPDPENAEKPWGRKRSEHLPPPATSATYFQHDTR